MSKTHLLLAYLLLSLPVSAHCFANKPKQIFVQLEWIKIKSSDSQKLAQTTKSINTPLRDAVQNLVNTNQAIITETVLTTARPGEMVQSIHQNQTHHPTGFAAIPNMHLYWKQYRHHTTLSQAYLFTPKYFSLKSNGTVIEIGPTIGNGSDSDIISVEVEVEFNPFPFPLVKKQIANELNVDNTIPQLPFCYKEKTYISIKNGSYQLLSQQNIHLADGSVDTHHIQLLFIRAVIKTTH